MFKIFKTYSFSDLSGVIVHPYVESSYIFPGSGIGQIVVTLNGEETEQQPVIGGSIIISKIPFIGGKLRIQCQQMSDIKEWLLSTYFTIKNAPAREWARMVATLRNIQTNSQETYKGIAFTKIPEETYSVEGDFVEWILLFTEYTKTASK